MTIKATDYSNIATTSSRLNAVKNVTPEKAWQAAQKFEAAFASHVIQQMFAHNDTGLFGGGQTEVMFRSIWAEKIAESMPGTFGIAESVYPILLKGQEVKS